MTSTGCFLSSWKNCGGGDRCSGEPERRSADCWRGVAHALRHHIGGRIALQRLGRPGVYHGWGLAIDINYRGAPFVMHESREQDLDAQLGPVYHRIAWLILGHASQIPEAITRAQRSDDTRQWFRALQAESEAMRRYFQMMRDPNDINWNTVYEDVTDAIWANLGLGPMPNPGDPQQAQVAVRDLLRRQMAQDYATLGAAGGADVGGGVMTPSTPAVQRRPDAQGNRGAADRPFAKSRPGPGLPRSPRGGRGGVAGAERRTLGRDRLRRRKRLTSCTSTSAGSSKAQARRRRARVAGGASATGKPRPPRRPIPRLRGWSARSSANPPRPRNSGP